MAATPRLYGVLPADHPVASWDDLCLFLGGSADSFTGQLLGLVAKADPGNLHRLRAVFPVGVRAWECWQDSAPAKDAEHLNVMIEAAEREWPGRRVPNWAEAPDAGWYPYGPVGG